MKVCVTTLTTADYFQHYLPVFIYVLRKEYPEYDVKVFIKGKVDKISEKAYSVLRENKIKFDNPINIFKEYPELESTTNCLRFLIPESYFDSYNYIFIVDADLLFFRTQPLLLTWYLKRMKEIGSCYGGYHGPFKKPHRPHITPRWEGKFERVSGGIFMVTQKWFEKTKNIRIKYRKKAEKGRLGGYREIDEVMLARILKKADMPMPPRGFWYMLRGVHLGDFKPEMEKRYKRNKKLKRLLYKECAEKFLDLESDPVWYKLIEILSQDKKFDEIYRKTLKYTEIRMGY